ncbi:MAG: tRNA-specific adenosine deaminase, partial [Pseudomonadota bacterium]
MTTAASLSVSPSPTLADADAAALSGVGEIQLGFMRQALGAAEAAAGRGEVPVGAVVVAGGV